MLLAVMGGAVHGGMGKRALWLLAAGGVGYLATCYLPFVDYSPRYYGILGTAILVLFLLLVRDWRGGGRCCGRCTDCERSPDGRPVLPCHGHLEPVRIFGIVTTPCSRRSCRLAACGRRRSC